MAALSSSATSISLALHASVVPPRRGGNNPAVATTSALQRRCLTGGLTMDCPGGASASFPKRVRGATRIYAVDPGSAAGGLDLLPGLSLPIPAWAQWLVGAFIFAVPAYRQFRAMEDKAEQTAEAAIEVIEKVAEEAEKLADDVADTFSGNEMIKEAAAKIKAVAEEVEHDADKAEAFIEKVDEIKADVDSIVEPIIEKVQKK